jgi:leucyl aminopeptidase
VWPFPLDEDFDTDIESQMADVAQCAVEGKGDHILAARFLGRFVPRDQAWAHVDLSSATRRGGLGHVPTEITGFGVRLALRLLLDEPLDDA